MVDDVTEGRLELERTIGNRQWAMEMHEKRKPRQYITRWQAYSPTRNVASLGVTGLLSRRVKATSASTRYDLERIELILSLASDLRESRRRRIQ